MTDNLLCPKSTNATTRDFSGLNSDFLKKPYVNDIAELSFINLKHLIPAISAASRYPYLSILVVYVGTEITIELPDKPAFSKKVFNLPR